MTGWITDRLLYPVTALRSMHQDLSMTSFALVSPIVNAFHGLRNLFIERGENVSFVNRPANATSDCMKEHAAQHP